MSKKPWSEVEVDLVEDVFYAHNEAKVRGSTDLAKDGMLDSLSIVSILEVLAEAKDFRNLQVIHGLYDRL